MTSTDIAVATTNTALTITPGQQQWTAEQLTVLRHMSTDKATPEDLAVFLHRCQALELDPFAGQAHLVDYGGKATIQVGIHGLESTARTAADRAGIDIEWEDLLWCGPDGHWQDVWLSEEPPSAAKAVLLRAGKRYSAVCLFREFVGQKKVYRNKQWTGEWEVNSMWTNKPAHMIGKCAKAGALRMAFPRQLANVYAPEELGERPTVIQGEVQTVSTSHLPRAPKSPLYAEAMAEVEGAQTRDDLRLAWEAYGDQLQGEERAQFTAAIQASPHYTEPEPEPTADADGVVVEPEPEQVSDAG